MGDKVDFTTNAVEMLQLLEVERTAAIDMLSKVTDKTPPLEAYLAFTKLSGTLRRLWISQSALLDVCLDRFIAKAFKG